MTARLAWIAAAPLLAVAVAASATYACAVWAANTLLDVDVDVFGDEQ